MIETGRLRTYLLPVVALAIAAAAGHAEPVRRVLGTEHLRVLYWPDHEELAEIARDAGREGMARLSRILDFEAQDRIEIYIVRSQAEFDELTGTRNRPSVIGRALTRQLRVVVKPMGPERLPDLVTHELAHVMLDLRMGDEAHRLTRWLHEGIAQYAEGGISTTQRRIIGRAAMADELLTIDELDDAFHGDSQQIALAYAQSFTLVEYLGEISPAEGISPLLDQLARGRDMRLALGLAFGRSVPVMEEEWLERLRLEHMGHLRMPPSEAMISALFLIAFFIALFFVRRRSARIRRRMEREERLRDIFGSPPAGPYRVVEAISPDEKQSRASILLPKIDDNEYLGVPGSAAEDAGERGELPPE